MKALIRKPGETVTEADGIPGIDWNTGMPLTCPDWAGGPYKLVKNYIPPVGEEDNVQHEQPKVEEEESVVDENDYVVIDGKKYNKEELRSLLE